MNGEPRAHYLPRLSPEFYQGDAVVHWTLTVFDRATGWLKGEFHLRFREIMLHAAVREGLFCPTYCLMPDHIHLICLGLRQGTDQRNGMSFVRTRLKPFLAPFKFQPLAHDHVLRDEERRRNAFAKTCFYILANPVRAGLMKETEGWPFCGAIIPGYPDLHPLDKSFWPKFWKLYQDAHSKDSGQRRLPRRVVQ
jgi:REP element-mobilizing transposase RayT